MQEIIKEKISLLEERYERQSNIELKNHYLKPLSPRCKEYWKRQAEITKNRIDLLKDILRTKELENKLEEDKMEKNTIRKVHITYKMVRGANDNEVAETCIDLPISQERYDELAEVINGESEEIGRAHV